MELPDDVLILIKEYSMPVTRADWRTLQKMTVLDLKDEFYKEYAKRFSVIRLNPYMKYKEIFSGGHFLSIFNWYYFQHPTN